MKPTLLTYVLITVDHPQTSEHALAEVRELAAQSKAELEQAKQELKSLQLTLQKERAVREQLESQLQSLHAHSESQDEGRKELSANEKSEAEREAQVTQQPMQELSQQKKEKAPDQKAAEDEDDIANMSVDLLNSSDLSPEDVCDLITHVPATEDRYIQKLVRILTIVASALVWDVRSVSSAYPSWKIPENERGTLVPETISKRDLIEMNDSWQFCLSILEVDLLFEYLDSSQNGQINLQSWSRALVPFYTAIKAMGRCFHRIVKTKAPKDSVDAAADV